MIIICLSRNEWGTQLYISINRAFNHSWYIFWCRQFETILFHKDFKYMYKYWIGSKKQIYNDWKLYWKLWWLKDKLILPQSPQFLRQNIWPYKSLHTPGSAAHVKPFVTWSSQPSGDGGLAVEGGGVTAPGVISEIR